MAEVQQLPSKFISVHGLSAARGKKYLCVICNSEGSFLCTQCRSCYCCREHLLLDDLACHSLLCDRQSAIREIMKLPLATRTRPEIATKLTILQDECRRVAYLESRRHVLEGNNELALPAAERSLIFAKAVHGDNSIELIPPLLALADVACLAGAQDAARGYASRARWLLLGKETELRLLVETHLRPYVRQCNEVVNRLTGRNTGCLSAKLSNTKSQGLQKLTKPFGKAFSSTSTRLKLPSHPVSKDLSTEKLQKAEESSSSELYLDNCISDEIFRTKEGIRLAFLSCRYWSTETRLRAAENLYVEALDTAAIACYFAALASGPTSMSTCLQLYAVSKLLILSMVSQESHAVSVMLQAQDMLRGTIIQFYAPYVIGIQHYCTDNSCEPDSQILSKFMAEFQRSDRRREEDERLAFRADIKEAVQYILFTVDYLERHYGHKAKCFIECVMCLALCLEIVEDASRSEYITKAWELVRSVDETIINPVLFKIFIFTFPV
ncbi:hypothetical protein GL50803_0033037 [Giardia duodenalis]|uniref:Zinc finger domain-containing protein n=1 Tax=Giardia intestinalis (strain ATCC 50803 / WB clone C6) TaxID=184922 RepID=A0A644EXS9_GIAIC|nr:Zinc finger domain [Giardia intestinalis]KAE8301257.1 hypothetical protein GL50803_0033037 [Giardia intestinalis]